MAKQCKTYKEFIKIQRKYSKRHSRYRNPYDIWNMDWVLYDVMNAEQVEEVKSHKKYCNSTLVHFLDETMEMLGHRVMLDHKENETGVVQGLQISNCDYYFIVKRDNDGGITYHSCIGHINVID